jgi:hypothetical protein
LRGGDLINLIHIRGHTTDFSQRVEALEVNHAPVTEVRSNDVFGLRVVEHAREHTSSTKCRPAKRKALDFRFVRKREI